jgi:hypothetical protein
LDEGIAKELDLVASALHKSQREIVESALDFYFDYTDGLMADRITSQIASGEMKTHDAKDVYAQLGIDL